MKQHRRSLGVAGALAWFLLGARPLHAAPAIEISYAGPVECPGETQFVAAVRARGGQFEGESDSRPRKMFVAIRRDGAGFSGTLRIEETGHASTPREVHAADCGEVIDGLAVVTAIALGRDERRAPSDASSAVTPGAAIAAAPRDAVSPLAAEPAEDRRWESVSQTSKEKFTVPAGILTFDSTLSLSATAGATFGAVPSVVLPRYDFAISRAHFVTTPDARNFLTGIIPRARWTYYGTGTYRSGDFATELRGFAGSLGGCSSLVYRSPGPVLLVCGAISAGAMMVNTKNGDAWTQTKTMGIASAEVDVEFRYKIGNFFHAGVTAGGALWVSPISAERPDGGELFRTSIFNGYATAGVGLHF